MDMTLSLPELDLLLSALPKVEPKTQENIIFQDLMRKVRAARDTEKRQAATIKLKPKKPIQPTQPRHKTGAQTKP